MILRAFTCLLPWPLRRRALSWFFGYDIHPTARIGLSWVFPGRLRLGPGARIGHLTVAKGLASVELGERAFLGNLNWVSGFPPGPSPHFAHRIDRSPSLVLGDEASVTHRHLLDCTDRVVIGAFTTLAGFRTQILTHTIDLEACRQDCAPVTIGERCFVGTACTILPGAALPDRSVLGAHALLNKAHTTPGTLYGGVPARALRPLDPQAAYFVRTRGFVT